MIDYKITIQVQRKRKPFTKVLSWIMIILGVLFLLMGIMFERGYMMFCFLFAALYFIFDANAQRDYEYVYEDDVLTIFVIKGKRRKVLAHTLRMSELEVVAPPTHDAVAQYRAKTGTEKIKKYDYTSYEEDIPYYTMIVYEDKVKKKILLDLSEELLNLLKKKYPKKVFCY